VIPVSQTPLPDYVDRYGFQFWLATFPDSGLEAIIAAGWRGQLVVVVPDADLVVAFNGGSWLGSGFGALLGLVEDYLIPAALPLAP
jgi:hypothetical protein